MWKAFGLLLIAVDLLAFAALASEQRCPFSYCNEEGECRLEAPGGRRSCKCIGTGYFVGSSCSEPVNHCASNPCLRPSRCINAVGQFLCEECRPGYGGQRCNVRNSNSLSKLLLQFNHYSEFGREHRFLLMVERLGSVDFALELIGENYAIDTWETLIADSGKAKFRWHKSMDLKAVARSLGIHHAEQLPYSQGYYHVARESFWHTGLLNIKLLVYDSESGSKLLYNHDYKLLVLQPEGVDCIPVVRFPHGGNPSEPLKVDISMYNNFEPLVVQRCRQDSEMLYNWKIFNSIGTKELHDFGRSDRLLKIPPYRLWFNYQGEVLASYRIVVAVTEISANFLATSEYRCFIFVLPKPVFAAIKGGAERKVGRAQSFTLDASKSRDFALDPNAKQDLLFSWDCRLDADRTDDYCQANMGKGQELHIESNRLAVGQRYTFYLTVTSKVNPTSKDVAQQSVTITEAARLDVDIRCLRNCMTNSYSGDDFIHLQAVYKGCRGPPLPGKLQWSLKSLPGEYIGQQQHLIYRPKATEQQLEFMVRVECDNYVGETSLKLDKSPPPVITDCSITPKQGVSFDTVFSIKCKTKVKKTVSVSYQFLVDGFPLDRTHDPETKTRLPPTNAVTVIICNAQQSCLNTSLEVNVAAYTAIDNIENFFETQTYRIHQLLKDHDTNAVLILCKMLSTKIGNAGMANALIAAISDFELRTVLDVEQVLTISNILLESLKPLTNEGALAFSRYLMKVNKGLRSIIADKEITELPEKAYQKATKELSESISACSIAWEMIPPAEISRTIGISSADPIAEEYDELIDFDVTSLQRIENWLTASNQLYECLHMLGVAAVSQHLPSEPPLIIDKDDLKTQVYAVNPSNLVQPIELEQHSVKAHIDTGVLKALAQLLNSESVVLQMVTAVSNPFWWYPAQHMISSNVLFISAFGRQHQQQQQAPDVTLERPIEFQFKLNVADNGTIKTTGQLKHTLHMPVFRTMIPPGSAVIITFIQSTTDLQIEMKWLRPPKAFEVKQSPKMIFSNATPKAFSLTNKADFQQSLHMAVRPAGALPQAAKFSFTTQIRSCLSWNFSSEDPQWTSQGCQAIAFADGQPASDTLHCKCYHLSAYAAQAYSTYSNEKLGERLLLESLPFNLHMLIFFGLVILIVMLSFSYACYRYLVHRSVLLVDSKASEENDAMVLLVSGHLSSPISTVNIIMTLQTINKPKVYKINVRQDPKRLHLLQSETSRFYIPAHWVQQPLKISLRTDFNGRYGCWYCERIVIVDATTRSRYSYPVQQWLHSNDIEIPKEPIGQQTKWQAYSRQLSAAYINWYQFQPVMGPTEFNDLPLIARTGLWVSQFLITLTILACYYGSTTLHNYEDERHLYNYVLWKTQEIFLMGLISYIVCLLLHLSYCPLLLWLAKPE